MKNNNDKLSELVFLLMLSHMRWRKIQEEGCNDPFWSDGANLNLIRNHIIYFRDEIRKLCENKNLPLPELYYEEVPPIDLRQKIYRSDTFILSQKLHKIYLLWYNRVSMITC